MPFSIYVTLLSSYLYLHACICIDEFLVPLISDAALEVLHNFCKFCC
jgi:hypothetical protein